MVVAGELVIEGSIDSRQIERGFSRIDKGFKRVEGRTQSFNADMTRVGQSAGRVATALGVIGTTGLSAIVGLAKNAPAVAPAMAKIGVEFERLTRTLGSQLRPYFEQFSETFTKFVNFVQAHPNITKGFALSAASLVGIAAMTKMITALKGTVPASMLSALAIVGAGYAIAKGAEKLADKTYGFLNQEARQIPGTLQSLADVDQSAADIAAQGFQPTPNATWSLNENTRKNMLLRWWDSVWS